MFLQILTVSCLVYFANAQIDVKDCTAYDAAVQACHSKHNITGGANLTWANVKKFYELESNIYCSAINKAKFADLAECIQKAYIACAKNDFHKLVASADGIRDAVIFFCGNYTEFDSSCLSEVKNCTFEKGTESAPASGLGYTVNKVFYCGQVKYNEQCLKGDKLNNCGKTNTKAIFMKIAEELIPPACDATSFVISYLLLLVSFFITF